MHISFLTLLWLIGHASFLLSGTLAAAAKVAEEFQDMEDVSRAASSSHEKPFPGMSSSGSSPKNSAEKEGAGYESDGLPAGQHGEGESPTEERERLVKDTGHSPVHSKDTQAVQNKSGKNFQTHSVQHLSSAWNSFKLFLKKFWNWLLKDTTSYKYWLERQKVEIPAAFDDADETLRDLRVLGNELRANREERKEKWTSVDLPKYYNTPLKIKILSNEKFLALVERYTTQYDEAAHNQEKMLAIWNELYKKYGNEANVRNILKNIEDEYLTGFKAINPEMFGTNFYKHMLHPLLLPTTYESKASNWVDIFEKRGIVFGNDIEKKTSQALRLMELCQEYREYVNLWQQTMESAAAIKVYVGQTDRITYSAAQNPEAVVDIFESFFQHEDVRIRAVEIQRSAMEEMLKKLDEEVERRQAASPPQEPGM